LGTTERQTKRKSKIKSSYVLGKKNDISLASIRQRKKELQEEIDRIETTYSQKVSKLEGGIQNTLKPLRNIRRRPFTYVGLSIAVGFLAGYAGRKKRVRPPAVNQNETEQSTSPVKNKKSNGFTSMLLREIKRMAARRAMVYITDVVDKKIMPKMTGETSDDHNGKQPSK
jgi:ElaB/YqjD/DUF883 family membrane-anchored ribosome-binding protein